MYYADESQQIGRVRIFRFIKREYNNDFEQSTQLTQDNFIALIQVGKHFSLNTQILPSSTFIIECWLTDCKNS